MNDKLFITKKQREVYSNLWKKVNTDDATPIVEAAEESQEKEKEGPRLLSQEEAIDYSSKIIGALRKKQKDHNSEFNTKAQFSKIKEAYRQGVYLRPEDSGKTCNQWGMANVNAFLKKVEEPDFEKADQDIKKYNMKVHFNNLEDLYLEEYSPINKVY